LTIHDIHLFIQFFANDIGIGATRVHRAYLPAVLYCHSLVRYTKSRFTSSNEYNEMNYDIVEFEIPFATLI